MYPPNDANDRLERTLDGVVGRRGKVERAFRLSLINVRQRTDPVLPDNTRHYYIPTILSPRQVEIAVSRQYTCSAIYYVYRDLYLSRVFIFSERIYSLRVFRPFFRPFST